MTPIRRYRLAFVVLLVGLEAGLRALRSHRIHERQGSDRRSRDGRGERDQIVLQWDPPASEVAKYIVSFRIHGDADWVPLGEIPAIPVRSSRPVCKIWGTGISISR